MLEPRYHVAPWLLGSGDTQTDSSGVSWSTPTRQIHRVEQIQLVLQELSCIREKLFVVHNQVRSMVAQAYALGATAVVSRPKESSSSWRRSKSLRRRTKRYRHCLARDHREHGGFRVDVFGG